MDDLLSVKVRLQETRQFIADAGKTAASVLGIGAASEKAAAQTKIARAETFAWRQGLYTLRRELFYGTAAAGAFVAESIHLGLAFDEAKMQGTDAFTAILGDSRLAGREMATLVGLTHQTGIGLGFMVSEATQMEGFGFTLKEINGDLLNLANYAERTGRGSAGLAALVEIFDRIRQSGKLTSLDLRSLNTQGISGLQILIRQLHLSATQAAALRAGQLVIPAQYALPALATGIGARADQLGTGLGQQVGIAHSYLSSLFGGGEQGLFSFATRGLERVNAALKVASGGGGIHGFLMTLDPSGNLILGWHLLEAAVKGTIAPFVLAFRLVSQLRHEFPILGAVLQFVAKQTWLVQGGLFALSTWYLVTRSRMLLFWAAELLVTKATDAYIVSLYALEYAAKAGAAGMWLLNFAMDANPIVLVAVGVVALAGGLYLLARRFNSVRDAAHDAWNWVNKPLFNWGSLNPWQHGFGLHVPKLAGGGTATEGGWSMVGERGPELRYLPRGASVVPLNRAPGGAMLDHPLEINLYVDGEKMSHAVVATPGRRRTLADGVAAARQLAEAGT